MSYVAYAAHQASFERVFTATIAASVGVAADAVKDLVVSDPAATTDTEAASVNLRAGAKTTIAEALDLTYIVQAARGVSYDQLASQLTESVRNGQFSDQLQQNAAAQNVPELTSATSSSIDTQDTTPTSQSNDNKTTALSAGAVVGVVIGAVVVLVFVMFIVYDIFMNTRARGYFSLNE